LSDLDDFKATYFDECSELLLDLEEQFAAIQSGDRSADRLNAVFRAIHSIKGGGGAFGDPELVAFAHEHGVPVVEKPFDVNDLARHVREAAAG